MSVEQEASYLGMQAASTDHVQYLAKVDGQIIGTASLNRKPNRMRHRGEFGISLKKAYWGCGPDGGRSGLCPGQRLCPAEPGGPQQQCPCHSPV